MLQEGLWPVLQEGLWPVLQEGLWSVLQEGPFAPPLHASSSIPHTPILSCFTGFFRSQASSCIFFGLTYPHTSFS